jgi:phage tail-like protein
MANDQTPAPFIAFNFAVEIQVPGIPGQLCSAAFFECDGLEMNMEVKTIREGGNNTRQIRLAGPTTYGMLSLKRGMSSCSDLWDWFSAAVRPGNAALRGEATVVVFAPDGQTERMRFVLERCLPAKLKASPLNAKDGTIAIEEMQIAYETLTMKRPGGA